MLVGYGAAAVNPYLMLETLGELVEWVVPDEMTAEEAQARAIKGIAQGPAEDDVEDGDLDHPVVLRRADLRGDRPRARLVERYFTSTPSRIGGIGLHSNTFFFFCRLLRSVSAAYVWQPDPKGTFQLALVRDGKKLGTLPLDDITGAIFPIRPATR